MEQLETIVIWALLVVTCGVGALIIHAMISKIQTGLTESTSAPGLLGSITGFGLAAWLLPSDSLPFLIGLFIAIFGGLAMGFLVSRALRGHDLAGLTIAIIATVIAVVAAVIVASPSKLVDFGAIVLVGVFTFALMGGQAIPRAANRYVIGIGTVAAFIGLFDWFQAKVGGATESRMARLLLSSEMERIAATVWAVVLAVGGSTALFVLANMLFDRTDRKWRQFNAIAGAAIGFVVFGILDGNRLIQYLGPRDEVGDALHDAVNNGFWTLLLTSVVIGALIGLVAGYALGVSRDDRSTLPWIGLVVGALLGVVWGTLFAQQIPVNTTVDVLWNSLTGALLCGLFGFVVSKFVDDRTRALVATAGGAAIGLLVGGMLFNEYQPRLETLPLIVSPVVVGALGAGINSLRRRSLVTGAATGALIGWLIGAFGFPTLGGGPEIETLVATGVAGGLAGLRYGAKPYLDSVGRVNLEQQSRAVIFLAPALSFIAVGLVIPLIRTIYLSLFDERSKVWVALDNYEQIFRDPKSFALSEWRDLFTSQLFRYGALLLIAALVYGMLKGRVTGNNLRGSIVLLPLLGLAFVFAAYREIVIATDDGGSFSVLGLAYLALLLAGAGALLFGSVRSLDGNGDAWSSATTHLGGVNAGAFALGIFLVAFAAFSALRGTLFNNMWWVFTVTLLATGFGLAAAVLADRASYENVAKSLIFMPLAISFVGAGIIWRFMYIARDPRKDQTGVMNFLWVELGKISTGGVGRAIGILLLLAMLVGLVLLALAGYRSKSNGTMTSSIVLIVLFGWMLWRFTFGGGMGGTGVTDENGNVSGITVLFLQDSQPFNNLWLMLVLIWIQTGFAMVIFSAAIKAVPTEFIEAAKMDGANDSQIFWRITVPSIAPTIGVVVTTLIVTVMKVFDIVKVMTNGNFDTQVVANEMWQRAFTELNVGLGSALAIVLFLAVVPVMYYNIRTMQKEV